MHTGDSNDNNLDKEIIHALTEYKGESKLKRAAMNILVKMVDTHEVQKLRETFWLIDKNGTGCIDVNEL